MTSTQHEELAIRGGTRAVPEHLKEEWPIIGKEEIFAMMNTLQSKSLWGKYHEQVTGFEEEYASYTGVKYAVAFNSGTASLHAAVGAIGVGPGDEVIVPALSFLASATPIVHHQGIPVFADIDPKTYNIDPTKIEEKLSEKTKGIMAVHFHGLPADMDEINQIAKKHNLLVIEDAAQAHGAEYKGKKVGSLGDVAGASIMAVKNLPTCGEGGIFTTDGVAYRDKADMIRMFGEVIKKGERRAYLAYTMGWNYRISPIQAAFARVQLKKLDQHTEVIQKNTNYLSEELSKIPGIIPPYVPEDRTHVYHIYRFKVDPKEAGLDIEVGRFRRALREILSAEGINVIRYQSVPLPGQPLFQQKIGYGKGCPWTCPHSREIKYNIYEYPNTLKIIEETLVLGVAAGGLLTNRTLINSYVDAFHKVFANLDFVVDYAKKMDYRPPWEEVPTLW